MAPKGRKAQGRSPSTKKQPTKFGAETSNSGKRGKFQREILLSGSNRNFTTGDGVFRDRQHLTLQQEAYDTEQRGNWRTNEKKLRELSITFVRPSDIGLSDPQQKTPFTHSVSSLSGINGPTVVATITDSLGNINIEYDLSSTDQSTNIIPVNHIISASSGWDGIVNIQSSEGISKEDGRAMQDSQSRTNPKSEKAPLQNEALVHSIQRNVYSRQIEYNEPSRSISPTSTSSEELVFTPKCQRTRRAESSEKTSQPKLASASEDRSTIWMSGQIKNNQIQPLQISSDTNSRNIASQLRHSIAKPRKQSGRRFIRPDLVISDEDDALEDYIKNIAESAAMEDMDDDDDNDTPNSALMNMRTISGSLDEVEILDDLESGVDPIENHEYMLEGNIAVEVSAVIGKRDGINGPLYRYKPSGSNTAEAIWIEADEIPREIQYMIDHFEAQLSDQFSDTGSSELDEMELNIEHVGSSAHEAHFSQDDEAIAKAMQAEEALHIPLAIGSTDDEDYDDDDLFNMMTGQPSRRGNFPSASKLADAYDQFDVMDYARPSLQKRAKGKAQGKSLEVIWPQEEEDDDQTVRAELLSFIERDREKKRSKKEERENMRRNGLLGPLGKGLGKRDLHALYKSGMAMEDVRTEIRNFLMGDSSDRLALSPMPKQTRARIHVLANMLFLTCKSQGSGNKRFPVLYKTRKTSLFEGDLNAIERVLYHGRTGGGQSGGRVKGGKRNGGDKSQGGRRHPEGWVVGDDAAQLSQGNKGFEMLSKMGWTAGTGLGSKRTGIINPIQAVIKNTKAGLG